MKGLACMRTWALIDRRAQGLSSAEALRLEEHVERCEACAEQLGMLDVLRGLATELPDALPQARRERAIEGALAQALGAQGVAARSWAGPRRGAAIARLGAAPARALAPAFGLALAAALALVIARPWSSEPAERGADGRAATTDTARTADRVLRGAVEIDGRPGAVGATLASRVTLRAVQASTLALAHGTLELAAGTALRWDRDLHLVTLERGSVTADVDPSARQRFGVQTPRFTVHVLGTRFTVDQDGVSVERGKVAVLAPDGTLLVPALIAGERFAADAPSAHAHTPDAARAETAAAAEAEAERAATSARVASAAQPGARGGDHAERQARVLLAQARAQLAAGDTATARRTLDAALSAARTRADRAEALSLHAECALVAGDLERAIADYLRVSRAYANLPAGQNALFAAARLQAERGQRAAAIELLQRYLGRYPRGRFVSEAGQRLAELDSRRRPTP